MKTCTSWTYTRGFSPEAFMWNFCFLYRDTNVGNKYCRVENILIVFQVYNSKNIFMQDSLWLVERRKSDINESSAEFTCCHVNIFSQKSCIPIHLNCVIKMFLVTVIHLTLVVQWEQLSKMGDMKVASDHCLHQQMALCRSRTCQYQRHLHRSCAVAGSTLKIKSTSKNSHFTFYWGFW